MRASLQATLHVLNRPEPLRQSSLLMVLASGVGDAESLISGLEALGQESTGIWQNRVNQLLYLLNSGQRMSEALGTTSGLLPNDTLVAIRVAEENGTLQQVLGEEAHRLSTLDTERSPVSPSLSSTILWGLVVTLVVTCILIYVLVNVVPAYVRIFDDFGVELPAATQLLISVTAPVEDFWAIILFPNITLIVTPILGIVYGLYRHITTGHVLFSERLIRFWSPLILRTLGASVAADGSVDRTLESIAKQIPKGRAASTVAEVRQKVIAGSDFLEELKNAGLIRPTELAFLRSGRNSNHLDWALLHLANSLTERRLIFADRLAAVIQPAIVISIGLVMAFLSVALFTPLVRLVNNMA